MLIVNVLFWESLWVSMCEEKLMQYIYKSKFSNSPSHVYEILHNNSNTSRISRYWYGNRLSLHKCPLIMITAQGWSIIIGQQNAWVSIDFERWNGNKVIIFLTSLSCPPLQQSFSFLIELCVAQALPFACLSPSLALQICP